VIPDKTLKCGDVVFIYKTPIYNSLAGIIDGLNYPFLSIITIPLEKSTEKYKNIEEIDISKNIPLSLVSENMLDKVFSQKELKFIKSKLENSEVEDIFQYL